MYSLAATWTGYVSDTGCGAKDADASGKSQKCVAVCGKGKNASAVLVADGSKGTVAGKLSGECISINTIAMAH